MKIILILFPIFLFAQIPDLGSQLQLKAINTQLSTIVSQNNLGLKTERANLAKLITSVQNTYESFKQLEKLNDQKEKFLKDIEAIKKFKIKDLSQLKNFVLHGDQLDFWFESTSANLISDLGRVKRFTNSADETVLYTNKTFGLEQINENLEEVAKAENDLEKSDYDYVQALPDQIVLQVKMADRFKQLANDESASMSQADRAKLLLMAQELEDKTLSRFRELQEEAKKLIEAHKKTQIARKKNKIANDYIRKYLNSVSSKVSYGLFKSNKFDVKLLNDLKWGKNY
jgi:hypothetical protein